MIDYAIISHFIIPPKILMKIVETSTSVSKSLIDSAIYSWVAPPPVSKKFEG